MSLFTRPNGFQDRPLHQFEYTSIFFVTFLLYNFYIVFPNVFAFFFVGMMGVEPTIRRNGFLDRRVCQFRHTPIFFVGMKGLEPLRPKTQHPKCCAPTNFATSPISDFLYILIGI